LFAHEVKKEDELDRKA